MKKGTTLCCLACLLLLSLSGCAFGWKSVRERQMESELGELKGRLAEAERSSNDLRAQVDQLQAGIVHVQEEKTQEAHELIRAQERLAESLKKELGDAQAKLAMTERGLVLTFLDEIFFDSGKAEIRPAGLETLQKVGPVLKETVPDSQVAVEGYTDNEPIKYSGWKSNWELSAARALAVLHYFVDGQGVPPERLHAVGRGEYHPVASNESAEGRRQNRRVEIVIVPKQLKKVR